MIFNIMIHLVYSQFKEKTPKEMQPQGKVKRKKIVHQVVKTVSNKTRQIHIHTGIKKISIKPHLEEIMVTVNNQEDL